jgi:Domain of unknown function (DUF5916)
MRTCSLILALALIPAAALADERPTVPATRTDSDIRVDGILDEPAWAEATPITDFRLIYVREGQAPSESTEVRVLFDDDHVYFGIWCGNRGPGAIRSNLAPRDEILDDDHVAVHLDTYRDMRRAYIFGVNADGVQVDGILDGDEPDFSWDAVWDAEAKRVIGGWVAEIAIPLRELRFPAGGGGTWGLWIRRQIMKNDEVCTWPLWKQANQGDIMLQAADLTGLEGIEGSGGLAVQPYVSMMHEEERSFYLQQNPAAGFQATPWSGEDHPHAGLDLQYGLTSTLTANATINPDYSQVEADAVQIDANQRFALFYPEKRPFFLEGAEIFNTELDLVYTRRIADPDAGAKLTGKQGPARIGVIAAYDAGGGSLAGTGAGDQSSPSGEGFVGIARTTWDFGENGNLGLLVTDRRSRTSREGSYVGPSGPVGQGGDNSIVAIDGRWRPAHALFAQGQVAWSTMRADTGHVGGSIGTLDRFDDLAFDGRLRYADGIRDVTFYQTYLGPDFRSETGFIRRVDVRESGVESDFIVRPENAWLRSWQPILNGYVIHDHTGGLQEWWTSPMIDWVFQKSTHAHTMYVRSMEHYLGRRFELNTYIFNLDNALFRPAAVAFYSTVGDGIYYDATSAAETFRGWREHYTVEATLRPSPRVTSALTVERSRFSREFQGEEIFDIWVMGANTTYQFTRRLFARVYPQYDASEHHLDGDVLIGYVVHPGTVLYLGYNGDYDRIGGSTRSTRRQVFFKASSRFLR